MIELSQISESYSSTSSSSNLDMNTSTSETSVTVDRTLNFMLGGIKTRSGRMPSFNLRYA